MRMTAVVVVLMMRMMMMMMMVVFVGDSASEDGAVSPPSNGNSNGRALADFTATATISEAATRRTAIASPRVSNH